MPVPDIAWRPDGVPQRLFTISECLMGEVPGPGFEIWWRDAAEAREVAGRSGVDAQVVAVGLAEQDVRSYLAEADSGSNDSMDLLKERQPMPTADVIGFEMVGGDDLEAFHSWHCHDYASALPPTLEVELDERGLFTSYDDASAVLDWIRSRPREHQPRDVPWVVVALSVVG